MPIPAPESWENAIAPYGIRVPKPTAPASKLPTTLARIGQDLTTALDEFGIPPVISSAWVIASTIAARDAITAPTLQAGLACYVIADGQTYIYNGSSWDGLFEHLTPPELPFFLAGVASNTAIGTSNTTINWTNEIIDTHTMHSSVGYLIQIPIDGVYEVSLKLYTSSTTAMTVGVYRESDDLLLGHAASVGASGALSSPELTTMLSLEAGQSLRVRALAASGTITVTPAVTFICVRCVKTL